MLTPASGAAGPDVAVTLEPDGGVDAPTGAPLFSADLVVTASARIRHEVRDGTCVRPTARLDSNGVSHASSTEPRAARRLFGFADFRPGQEEVVRAAVAGRDTLALMPTGSGKSLPYQLAAMLRPTPTLVVSPLIALMKDQVDKLPPAVAAQASVINSSLDPDEAGGAAARRRRRAATAALRGARSGCASARSSTRSRGDRVGLVVSTRCTA